MNKWKNYLAATLLGACVQAYAAPILTASPTPNPVTVGSSVDLNVMISDIADLYAYEFTLTFDARLLRATAITEGGFLGTAGTTFGDTGVIDNAAGTISFVFNTLLGPVPGAYGSGSLARVRFESLGAGSSPVGFSEWLFLDSVSNDIVVGAEAAVVQAVVQDVPEPATYLLFGVGLVAVGALRRRQLSVRA